MRVFPAGVAIELQAQAIDDALRRGLIRRRQFEDVAVATAGALRIALETTPAPTVSSRRR